jgi:hypothetical protein
MRNLLCLIHVISSHLQTKEWRLAQSWYKNGKHNECEIFQKKLVKQIIGIDCKKTNFRINLETKEMVQLKNPLVKNNGFEWTENFDGHINNTFYFNFKMICESGGSQTRSLKDVYQFITAQLEHLKIHNKHDKYFINILDGKESYRHRYKFKFLLKKYNNINQYVFVGDTHCFKHYWKSKINNTIL